MFAVSQAQMISTVTKMLNIYIMEDNCEQLQGVHKSSF